MKLRFFRKGSFSQKNLIFRGGVGGTLVALQYFLLSFVAIRDIT